MLQELFEDVYEKFKLNFYKNIFRGLGAREASLTATETFCAEVIHALKRPTINEMANFLELSQPNMTYKVNSLIKKGYVKKIRSKKDRREYYLEVTEKFYAYYRLKNDYIEEVLERLVNAVSKEELKQFESVLALVGQELMPEVSMYMEHDENRD